MLCTGPRASTARRDARAMKGAEGQTRGRAVVGQAQTPGPGGRRQVQRETPKTNGGRPRCSPRIDRIGLPGFSEMIPDVCVLEINSGTNALQV